MHAVPEPDPLKALAEQHGQITEWAAQVRVSAVLGSGRVSPEVVVQLAQFYRAKVLPHLHYEERSLFPAVLEVCGTPSLHQRLRAIIGEHEELRLRIEILLADLESLAAAERSEALERATARRAQLTVDRLLEHAAAEDALLMPLLDRHGREVLSVLGGPRVR